LKRDIRNGTYKCINNITFLKYFTKDPDKLLKFIKFDDNGLIYYANYYECIISSIAISHLYLRTFSIKI